MRNWILCGLAVVGGSIALAAAFLPWWGVLALFGAIGVGLVYGVPWLIKRGLSNFAKNLFDTKSRVLRGATLTIHEIAFTDPPPMNREIDDQGETAEPNRLYVLLDATINPVANDGPMSMYDPTDFQLVPFDADVSFEASADSEDPETYCSIAHIQHITDSGDAEEPDKIAGPSRFRMIFSCPASMPGRVKLRYYFESIGDFTLPSPSSSVRRAA